MKLHAIIFDLDGTLLNTLDDLTNAVNRALAAFGFGGIELGRVRRYVGDGVPKLMERVTYYVTTGNEPNLKGRDDVDGALCNAMLAAFTEYYNAHNADMTAPYAGIAEMLAQVKERGIKTAVVTNKYDGAAQMLKKRFFADVDTVIGAREGLRPKPAPDGVISALSVLGVKKENAVYVGDGETDMLTAKNCGMPVVAVTWGFRDAETLKKFAPQAIISEPSEIFGALRSMGFEEIS